MFPRRATLQDASLEILGGISLQMPHGHTKGCALLDLLFINKEELAGFVEVESRFDCSDHKIVEFKMLKEKRKACSRTKILNFRRLHCVQGMGRQDPLSGCPGDRRAQESRPIFKDNLLKAQELSIPLCKIMGRHSLGPQ